MTNGRIAEAISSPAGENVLSAGNISVDLDCYKVTVAGEEVELTAHELDLLRILCANRGRVLGYHALTLQLWGKAGHMPTRHLNVLIHRLRTKIAASYPYVIDTVRGRGYGLLPTRSIPTANTKARHPDPRAGPSAPEPLQAEGA